MKRVSPTSEGLAIAAEAIRAGKVVAYPTETVYGLGVDPFSKTAVERLFAVKERDRGKPVLLIVANEEQLRRVVMTISPGARACMAAFWPGPLSLLFPKSPRVPDVITAGSDTVCVRCPSSQIARDLCLAAGSAITSSSANVSGKPAARLLAELNLAGVALAIDGGALEPSPPSTVFDPDTGIIVRNGVIAEAAILDATRKSGIRKGE